VTVETDSSAFRRLCPFFPDTMQSRKEGRKEGRNNYLALWHGSSEWKHKRRTDEEARKRPQKGPTDLY